MFFCRSIIKKAFILEVRSVFTTYEIFFFFFSHIFVFMFFLIKTKIILTIINRKIKKGGRKKVNHKGSRV